MSKSKRRRSCVDSDEDETNLSTKYRKSLETSNKQIILLNNFQITPKLFYSKKSSNDEKYSLPVQSISNDEIIKNISLKSQILLNEKYFSRNLNKKHKKITKKLYSNEPKLGNKGVSHRIQRPKKIKITPKKLLKILEDKKIKEHQAKELNQKIKINNNNNNNNKVPIQKVKDQKLNLDNIEYNDGEDGDDDDDYDSFDSDNDELSKQLNDDQNENEENENINENKKFFKSGNKSIKNECKIMGNLKVTMSKGKLFVVSEKSKNSKKYKLKQKQNFSKERAIISSIIQRLSCSPEPSSSNNKENVNDTSNEIILHDNNMKTTTSADTIETTIDMIELLDNEDFSEFRNRIPYNTNDPEIMERQHLLLDFLISHNICNEENFKIFIADPENHTEKAAEIIDSITLVVSTTNDEILNNLNETNSINDIIIDEDTQSSHIYNDFEIQIQKDLDNNDFNQTICDTENSESNEIQISNENDLQCLNNDDTNSLSHNEIVFENNENSDYNSNDTTENLKISHNSNINDQKKLFPIFLSTETTTTKCNQSESIPLNRKRNTLKAFGMNQYQIDAGQKEFGAKQCPQCGLLYTVHEPEEEKLHMEYHESLYVLRFKGWTDENIVQECPEWGLGGRIITITDLSNIKRKERLMNVIDVVDKELGFTSYIFPTKFTAYLAIRKNQIAGLCLVQPLQKANKYICQNGVDCCTEEFYDAKCGISRIWVSSLHRRIGIASRLIRAIQLHFIPGIEINLNEIAFSAPTESGKAFARKITNRDDFLVYQ